MEKKYIYLEKNIIYHKDIRKKTKVCQKNQKTSFSEKKISHEKFG